MRIKRREHTIPSLNLAAMPDLIFTVLFFFMIVTHMRNVTPLVRYETPQGTELSKPKGKQPSLYIYVGSQADFSSKKAVSSSENVVSSSENTEKQSDSPIKIQVNNRFVEPEQLAAAIEQEKMKLPIADRHALTATLKADRHTPMQVIMQIKQALRDVGISRVTYSATKKSDKNTPKNLENSSKNNIFAIEIH